MANDPKMQAPADGDEYQNDSDFTGHDDGVEDRRGTHRVFQDQCPSDHPSRELSPGDVRDGGVRVGLSAAGDGNRGRKLGITQAAVIGAGLFVRTAAALAEAAGPSVILSFVEAAFSTSRWSPAGL
jgi:hypothetical protein